MVRCGLVLLASQSLWKCSLFMLQSLKTDQICPQSWWQNSDGAFTASTQNFWAKCLCQNKKKNPHNTLLWNPLWSLLLRAGIKANPSGLPVNDKWRRWGILFIPLWMNECFYSVMNDLQSSFAGVLRELELRVRAIKYFAAESPSSTCCKPPGGFNSRLFLSTSKHQAIHVGCLPTRINEKRTTPSLQPQFRLTAFGPWWWWISAAVKLTVDLSLFTCGARSSPTSCFQPRESPLLRIARRRPLSHPALSNWNTDPMNGVTIIERRRAVT